MRTGRLRSLAVFSERVPQSASVSAGVLVPPAPAFLPASVYLHCHNHFTVQAPEERVLDD